MTNILVVIVDSWCTNEPHAQQIKKKNKKEHLV